MLKRLQDSKSTYNVEQWEVERVNNLKVVNMRAKYEMKIVSKKDLRGITKEERFALETQTGPHIRCNSALGPLKLQRASLGHPRQQLTSISKLINKATSRYDDDYVIENI